MADTDTVDVTEVSKNGELLTDKLQHISMKNYSDPDVTLISFEKESQPSMRLNGTPLLVGSCILLGLLYTNYVFFQPYFTSILFAWAVSIPLRPVKDSITNFLKEGLKNREETEAWDFVRLSFTRVFLHVFFGEKLSQWFFNFFSSFLFPDLNIVDAKSELKLRPLDDQQKITPSISTEDQSCSQKPEKECPTEKTEKDVFRDLKDSSSANKPVPKTSTIEKTSLDPLIIYLQRPDWYYLLLIIRSCVVFSLGKLFLHYRSTVIVIAALAFGARTLSSNLDGKFTSARNKLNGVLSLGQSLNSRVKPALNRWVYSNVEGSVATFLLLGIVSGIVLGSYTLYTSIVSEIKGGMRYYFVALVKRVVKEVVGLINAIALNSQYAPKYISTIQEYADGFLKDQLKINSSSTDVAKYVSTPEFATWMSSKAPVTWGLMKGSIEKGLGKLSDFAFLTNVVQELQTLVQTEFQITGAQPSADLSSYAPMVALPVIGVFSTLTSSLLQGFLIPCLVAFLDSIFQVVVFAVVLSGLLSQKESPLEPARRLLGKLWGENGANFEHRLATRVEEQIGGICLFTVQMGIFHTLFSWLSLHITQAPGPCIFALLSGIIAIIPVGGPFLGVLPPALVMWHGEGRHLVAGLLFVSHIVVATTVDSNFYSHLPTASSFFVALAAFLGHAVLGLQGILIGPLVLSMVPVLYSEFLVDTDENTT